ncbi:MAG: hypothetical protein ACRD00_08445 [Thermoanaerobaculia bacterium]
MRRRRAAALAAAALLAALLLARISPGEINRRIASLDHLALREPAVRRLSGTAAAFDRPFFVFLESARRRLPAGAAGVAILGAPATDQVLYLASYQLAPLPVLVAPAALPARWVAAVYGSERPPGWRVLAEVAGGALLTPAP